MNSEISNLTSNSQEFVFYYVDEHSAHAHERRRALAEDDVIESDIEQESVLFQNINQTVIGVNGATIHESVNITFSNCLRAINGYGEGGMNFNDSLFENLGSESLSSGAALLIDQKDLHFFNVTFRNNKAIDGAALDLN
jgi:hypothetical protein